ncbi:MAG TPA: YfhO family protein, partial [Thermoanaerobaculia bacterium]
WRKQLSVGVPVSLLILGAGAELLGIFAVLKKNSVPILLAAIAIQRVAEDGNIYPALPREQFYPRVPLIEAIPREPLYRFAAIDSMVVPNVGSMYGLEDVRGYAAMTSIPYQRTLPLWCPDARRTWHDIQDLSRPFLNFLGVKYALTPRSMEPPPGWRVLADDRGSRLVENANAIPRVFVPRHLTYLDDDDAALEQMRGANDFADNAWISTRAVPPHVERNGEATLATNRAGTARYEIDVDARGPTRIVITESNWPGWRAYIDGRRVNAEPANLAFLSVHVPAGRHRVRVVYRPDAYVRGRAISIATAVLLAIGFTLRMRRR